MMIKKFPNSYKSLCVILMLIVEKNLILYTISKHDYVLKHIKCLQKFIEIKLQTLQGMKCYLNKFCACLRSSIKSISMQGNSETSV